MGKYLWDLRSANDKNKTKYKPCCGGGRDEYYEINVKAFYSMKVSFGQSQYTEGKTEKMFSMYNIYKRLIYSIQEIPTN